MNIKYAGKSDEAVKRATGKSWDQWFKILDSAESSKKPHKDIVLWIMDQGLLISGWWAQSVVVGYEEKIGRRVFGAKTAGNYTVTVGKSIDGSVDDVLKKWESLVKGKKKFNKVKVTGDSRISSTKDWRYWKADFADGAKLSVNIGPKNDTQSSLSVTLDKLKGEKEVEERRRYWKEFLEKL